MKHFFILLLLLCSFFAFAQEGDTENTLNKDKVEGVLIDSQTNAPIESVNIVNLNQVIGTTTNEAG